MDHESAVGRHIGLFGATSVGVGAIVGGGILALAGVAFATTGPAAIVAFAINGVIAILTALSFAELSAAFPQSGGTYTFAKKVLSVKAAFSVGWIVWFASIVAAVLYAIGFASFADIILDQVWQMDFGMSPAWLTSRWMVTLLAIGATVLYTYSLVRKSAGGGQWANIGKVVVFGVLIAGGLWALPQKSIGDIQTDLTPFFAFGFAGLVQAMGYTFIALQGFDLIAAVAGEVRDPGRNLPKAMLFSLGIALTIYLPLLFIIATVGMAPGETVTAVSADHPETIVAIAAQTYLGNFGYWLVMVAAILSMLSALQANLFAASRVAMAMARDRTLPHFMDAMNKRYGTPAMAIITTGAIVVFLLLILSDVAAAGAASSLIFLITFAVAHGINILAHRRRKSDDVPFKVPLFPLVPALGALACVALAVFQGLSVPSAGAITATWLVIGGVLYLALFARRAQVVDASAEALDPNLVRLRGRNPLVLVPIANPANAEAMIVVANALAPPTYGRVLLLSVVSPPEVWKPDETPPNLEDAQAVLRESLTASFAAGLASEALITIAPKPWSEISRVARIHRCESMLLGFTRFSEDTVEATHLEELMSGLESDVVVLRAPQKWHLNQVKRVLVPVGGLGHHDVLRARLLGSLLRTGTREVSYLKVLPLKASERECARAYRELHRFAKDELPDPVQPQVLVVQSDNPAQEVASHTPDYGLVILGLPRGPEKRRVFGSFTLEMARETHCALIMISRKV